MLTFFYLCIIVALASAKPFDSSFNNEFHQFKQQYGKTYTSKIEEEFRMKFFIENSHFIDKHNKLYEKGLVTFKLAVNQFSDLLNHEFRTMMNGFKSDKYYKNSGSTFLKPNFLVEPSSLDWRTKGYVTNVKGQGNCGSCWAFSSTGSLEGQHFKKTGNLISLSEENLVDCSWSYGNFGCDGGWMNNSFQYIKDNGGIDTEESYPYYAYIPHLNGTCKYDLPHSGATVTGYTNTESGNESDLLAAVAAIGPVSVAIDASNDKFKDYSDGVYFEPTCKTKAEDLNHAVLVVGYGTDPKGGDYWIVKNSWGADWGNKGYILMARNKNNMCGVYVDPACNNKPDKLNHALLVVGYGTDPKGSDYWIVRNSWGVCWGNNGYILMAKNRNNMCGIATAALYPNVYIPYFI
ncbi:hypothetical protein CHUAL_002205 [Chamberlinius hualienensis]